MYIKYEKDFVSASFLELFTKSYMCTAANNGNKTHLLF